MGTEHLYEAILLTAWRERLKEYDRALADVRTVAYLNPYDDPLVQEGLRTRMGLPRRPDRELLVDLGADTLMRRPDG